MNSTFKRIISLALSFFMLANLVGINVYAVDENEQTEIERYTVLVLDTSGDSVFLQNGTPFYTASTALPYVKDAATKFVDALSSAKGTNYIATVSFHEDSTDISDFTSDTEEAKQGIMSLKTGEGQRSIANGLKAANSLMQSVENENTIKNIVLLTTGMTNDGDYSYQGHYDSSTVGSRWVRSSNEVNLYAYANVAYDAAQEIKSEGINLYSIGLFQTMEDMPENGTDVVDLFKLTASDISSGEDYYYEVYDNSELVFIFGEVAQDLIDEAFRNLYVKQHQDYIESDNFKREIRRQFDDCVQMSIDHAKGNHSITAYNTLNSVKDVFTFDISNFDETDEYELLLAQIFFNDVGEEQIETMYRQYYADVLYDVFGTLLESADFVDVLGHDKDIVVGLLKSLQQENPLNSDFFNEAKKLFHLVDAVDAYEGYDFIGELSKQFTENATDNICGFGFDVIADELSLMVDSYSEAIMYCVAGEAYIRTADSIGDMILSMRRNIAIPSDNELFNPFNGSQFLVNEHMIASSLGLSDVKYHDVLGNKIQLREIANALEQFYLCISEYKQGDASEIAYHFIERIVTGTGDQLVANATEATLSLFRCIPFIREYYFIKEGLKATVSVINLTTKIDDYSYDGTALMRLYCLGLIHYPTIDMMARTSKSWNYQPPDRFGLVPFVDGFTNAVRFDAAVDFYKSIQLVAAEYAMSYGQNLLEEEQDDLFESRKKVSEYALMISCAAAAKLRINDIHCHSQLLDYDEYTETFYYDTDKVKIVTIACPVAVHVYDPDGNEIAVLSDSDVSCEARYQHYFFSVPFGIDDYAKVVVIPDDYYLELEGNGEGTMNVFVANIENNILYESNEVMDVPVQSDSVGYLTFDEDSSLFELHFDGQLWSSTDDVPPVPTDDDEPSLPEKNTPESPEDEKPTTPSGGSSVAPEQNSNSNTGSNSQSSTGQNSSTSSDNHNNTTTGNSQNNNTSESVEPDTEIGENIVDSNKEHKHSYTYIDNNDGTHTQKCDECDKQMSERHLYVDNKCLCGADARDNDEKTESTENTETESIEPSEPKQHKSYFLGVCIAFITVLMVVAFVIVFIIKRNR